MIAIGIDPGTIKTGYGIIRKDGGRIRRLDSGVLKLGNKVPLEDRLLALNRGLDDIFLKNGPDEAAVESLFFAKNANSALKLGHARGVILLNLKQHNIPIYSYPPTVVKKSVVGGGRAAKGQVQRVVQAILGLEKLPLEDEADALAIAICHVNAPKIPSVQKK